MKTSKLKTRILGLLLVLSSANSWATNPLPDLPTLHKAEGHIFTAPYSCQGNYEASALFLSKYSKQRNSPELLFNGACGSDLYIEAATAGDDFALIADLGRVSIESVSASKAFNYQRTVGKDNSFKQTMPAIQGHTYAVLIAKSEIRALYVLHINLIDSKGRMAITYAVKSYSIQKSISQSPGFEWEEKSK